MGLEVASPGDANMEDAADNHDGHHQHHTVGAPDVSLNLRKMAIHSRQPPKTAFFNEYFKSAGDLVSEPSV